MGSCCVWSTPCRRRLAQRACSHCSWAGRKSRKTAQTSRTQCPQSLRYATPCYLHSQESEIITKRRVFSLPLLAASCLRLRTRLQGLLENSLIIFTGKLLCRVQVHLNCWIHFHLCSLQSNSTLSFNCNVCWSSRKASKKVIYLSCSKMLKEGSDQLSAVCSLWMLRRFSTALGRMCLSTPFNAWFATTASITRLL